MTVRQFSQEVTTINTLRGALAPASALGSVYDRDFTAWHWYAALEEDEEITLRFLSYSDSIIVFIDRRRSGSEHWEEHKRYDYSDLDNDGKSIDLGGDYDYRIIMANSSTIRDPYDPVTLEVNRGASSETTVVQETETFVLGPEGQGGWLIRSSTVP